ncbi:MAG TPA: hypothetical protein VIO94_06925 [Phenylobacterium sp.]
MAQATANGSGNDSAQDNINLLSNDADQHNGNQENGNQDNDNNGNTTTTSTSVSTPITTVNDQDQENGDDGNQINGNSLLSGNTSNDGDDGNQANGNALLSNNDGNGSGNGGGNDDNETNDNGNFRDNDFDISDNGDNRDNEANDNGNNRDNDDHSTNVDVEVSLDDSFNTTYEDSQVSTQTLSGTVTDTRVIFEDASNLIELAAEQGVETGDISQENDAFRGFTGIATVAMDTSFGSVNQAATNVTVGSDVSFD